MASYIPALARKAHILPAFLFAVPLALVQGITIFLFGFGLVSLMFPWFLAMLPWLLSMLIGFALSGGLCSFTMTRNVPDETISANRGSFSGLLTGLFSSLLGFLALILLVVWYTNWWTPTLSPQRPASCVPHLAPFACMSPQAGARLSLITLPIVILAFLLGNVCFIALAMRSGALVGRLRARRNVD